MSKEKEREKKKKKQYICQYQSFVANCVSTFWDGVCCKSINRFLCDEILYRDEMNLSNQSDNKPRNK